MTKAGMLAIDADGDRAIQDYLKSVAEWMEYGRTPAEDRAAVVKSLREQMAPPAILAGKFPSLAFGLLALAYAPAYVQYYRMRQRSMLAVAIPVALGAAMLAYLALLWFGLYLCLFSIPKLPGG